jgi:hypothetical protein
VPSAYFFFALEEAILKALSGGDRPLQPDAQSRPLH